MIIEKQIVTKVENLVGESFQGFDMEISPENMAYIMTLLSDLYKDPYSIIPQELLSNSWDSHIEAGCPSEPIVCTLKKDINDKWYFAAEDFGVGISPERVKIFGSYGKSTKRETNDFIGGWGIGAKSSLSYTKTFYIDTVYNGTRYIYLISPNEEGIPRIDLLSSEETRGTNKSKVWFYLKKDESYYYHRDKEHQKFVKGIAQKTLYFNNLVYNFDSSLENLNSYKRIEGKHFVYSEKEPFSNLHILIGQVPYEIDWQYLGMSAINVPIAIKIEKDVYPTPTREAYTNTDIAKEAIKRCIALAATEIVELYNKQVSNITGLVEWLSRKQGRYYLKLNDKNLYFHDITPYSKTDCIKPVFEPLKGLDISNICTSNILPFNNIAIIKGGRKQVTNGGEYFISCLERSADILRINSRFISKKNTFIGNTVSNRVFVFTKKKLKLSDYKAILSLKKQNVSSWRNQIIQYQAFVEKHWNSIASYEDIVLPKEQKVKSKSVKTKKAAKDICVYELVSRSNYDYDFATAISNTTKPILPKKLVIYGLKEDRQALDYIWRVSVNVSLMFLAPSNLKYLTEHQYVNVKNWHKTKVFSRTVTAYEIYCLLKQYESLISDGYNRYGNGLSSLSSEFKGLVDELSKYQKKNLQIYSFNSSTEKFMQSCVETADSDRLWDYSIYHKINRLAHLCERFKFVEAFDPEKAWVPIAREYIKKASKNVRMDLKHYQHDKTL